MPSLAACPAKSVSCYICILFLRQRHRSFPQRIFLLLFQIDQHQHTHQRFVLPLFLAFFAYRIGRKDGELDNLAVINSVFFRNFNLNLSFPLSCLDNGHRPYTGNGGLRRLRKPENQQHHCSHYENKNFFSLFPPESVPRSRDSFLPKYMSNNR